MTVTYERTRGRCKCKKPCADEMFSVIVWGPGQVRGDTEHGAERSPMLASEAEVIAWQVREHERRWARIHDAPRKT